MATWEESKDLLEKICGAYAHKNPDFGLEKWDLISMVWLRGQIQKCPVNHLSKRINYDIIDAVREYTSHRAPDKRKDYHNTKTNSLSYWSRDTEVDEYYPEPITEKHKKYLYDLKNKKKIYRLLQNAPMSNLFKDIIISKYLGGETLKEIGKKHNYSESRISQLHTLALKILSSAVEFI